MSKKKREVIKEDHYKDIINKQKSIIKKLSKKAGRGNKLEERFYNIEDEVAELLLEEQASQKTVIKKNDACPECGSDLDVIAGTKIKVFICTNCKYRKTKKN